MLKLTGWDRVGDLLSFGFIVNFQGVKVSWASELELGLSVLLLDDNAYERNKNKKYLMRLI